MKTRALLLSILACFLAAALCGCQTKETQSKPMAKSYFSYFDTISYVYNYANDSEERFDRRSSDVSHILETYHKYFDIYHEYSGVTNLCTLNKNAGGEPMAVDRELMDFLVYAKRLCAQTEGEMDIMLGSVLSIWHNLREEAGEDPSAARLPTQAELSEAKQHMGLDLLEIDEEAGTVRITDPKASIDVGALGKGYAVEKAAQYLEAEEAWGYVLNVGGNLRILGTKPDGSEWVTGIRSPDTSAADFAVSLRLSDTACVTSGVYERYYTVDGQRYHHIIDKDTLYPATYFDSLTVVTKDSGLADALSTALFCMSYEDGLSLAQAIGDVEVLWIFPDGQIKYTPGLENRIISPQG